MNFYLGCAVWSYKPWVGNFYPPQSRERDFLQLYSQRFTAVEGNTTFYAVPSAATVAKWASQTSPEFKFCPKFPRQITHSGLLQAAIPEAFNFIDRISGLGDRLGTVFIQLPPSYSPQYFDDLTAFLQAIDNKVSLAVEVRHLDWFKQPYCDRLNQMLTAMNVARVLLDTRPIYSSPKDPQANSTRRKPKVPVQPIVTNNCSLVRFISHPQAKYNQSYLEEWTQIIDRWLRQGKTVYFFVHCPQEERSTDTARYFYSLLQQQNSSLLTLPWNNLKVATQLSLF
ncbi:DUF72 domain-containing protein [Myxosarcina sp. GI1]|uniref:DUF72 domain-containing protein n=1 Tax=Myxosarcina sp. GI1 TaxID=1541065 RepID=UPI00055DEB92|nr:DUF72 domain-containing protein [Myxosarcina sp. GI1]